MFLSQARWFVTSLEGHGSCPPELQEVGDVIARFTLAQPSCAGLLGTFSDGLRSEVPVRSFGRICWRALCHRRRAPEPWPFFREGWVCDQKLDDTMTFAEQGMCKDLICGIEMQYHINLKPRKATQISIELPPRVARPQHLQPA